MARTFEVGEDLLAADDKLASQAKQDEIIAAIGANGAQSAFDHGSKGSIGTSAVQMTASSIAATRGVVVTADVGNTATVYIGNSDVTADTTEATDGLPILAGESAVFEVDNANLIYLRSTASGQKVFFATV